MRYTTLYSLGWLLYKKKKEITNIDKEVENWKELLYIAGGNIK